MCGHEKKELTTSWDGHSKGPEERHMKVEVFGSLAGWEKWEGKNSGKRKEHRNRVASTGIGCF